MRVALDARWMQLRPLGGVGRTLARVVTRLPADVGLELLTDARWPAADTGRPEHPLAAPWPGHATVWLQWSAPRWLRRFDGVFHCPFYALPLRQPVPMVVTLHDLSFEDHPEWFPHGRAWSFRLQARHAARTARVVLAPSEHVRAQLVERYAVAADRVIVAAPGVDPVFRPDRPGEEVRRRLGIDGRYVVALAGGPRRNLPVAVAAWRQVATAEPVTLVVVGRTDLQGEPGLLSVGAVDDETWAALLANAELLLYPTGDEGFGMPALEAAASGTPVVCARRGALPEVLGEAAAWTDEITATAFAERAVALLRDDAEHRRLGDEGIARAAGRPGWDAAAAAHVTAWRRAATGA